MNSMRQDIIEGKGIKQETNDLVWDMGVALKFKLLKLKYSQLDV